MINDLLHFVFKELFCVSFEANCPLSSYFLAMTSCFRFICGAGRMPLNSLTGENDDDQDILLLHDEAISSLTFNPPRVLHTKEDISDFYLLTSQAKVVAIDYKGSDISRIGTLHFVAVGVRCVEGVRVFIFDCRDLNLSPIESGLEDKQRHLLRFDAMKYLFEHTGIVKLIHDCRHFSDLLHKKFGINLAAVIDTMIWMTHFNDDHLSLHEAMKKYCPGSATDTLLQSLRFRNISWNKTPMTRAAMQYMALRVECIFELYAKIRDKEIYLHGMRLDALTHVFDATVKEYRSYLYHGEEVIGTLNRALFICHGSHELKQMESLFCVKLFYFIDKEYILILGNDDSNVTSAKNAIRDKIDLFFSFSRN